MLNLSVGLALVTSWLLGYVALPTWFVHAVGVSLYPLVIFGGTFCAWVALVTALRLWKVTVPKRTIFIALLLSNLLSITRLVLHAYGSVFINAPSKGAHATVDEITNPGFLDTIEFYLRVAHPFLQVIVIVSVATHLAFLFKSIRCRNGMRDGGHR